MYYIKIKEVAPSKNYEREYELFTTEKDKIVNEEIKKAIKEGKNEIEIPNAYGERNPELVTLIPLRVFKMRGINPIPGMVIELGQGITGIIKAVSGGRVVIDLNHPLAGETVKFFIEVQKKFEDEIEFFKELLEHLSKSNPIYKQVKEHVEIRDKIKVKNKDFEPLIKELKEIYGLNLDIESETKETKEELNNKKEENK
jgi:FKBP-type peptidyl-prolyl cis-trans isomerase 2